MPDGPEAASCLGRFGLALPAAALAAIDVALTLAGQGADYWAGDFGSIVGLNPIGVALLQAHPAAFAAAGATWVAGLLVLIGRVDGRAAVPLAFAATLGHAIGGAGWLWRLAPGPFGAVLSVGFLLAAGRLANRSWRRAGWTP